MKRIAILLLITLLFSFNIKSQNTLVQTISNDSCGNYKGIAMKTFVKFNKKTKDYSIINELSYNSSLIDSILLTVNGDDVDTIKSFNNINPGNYRVRYIDNRGCTVENKGWIYIDGMELNNIKPSIIKCYPNPLSTILTIEYEIPNYETYFVQIRSFELNYIVAKYELSKSEYSMTINTSNFKRGKYQIELLNKTEVFDSKKLIKIH